MIEDIAKIQKKIIKLLKSQENKTLSVLSQNSCSEISRLAGSWILELYPSSIIYIAKGEKIKINKTPQAHDILLIEYDKKTYLVDPTIWQFFPSENNILIGVYNNLNQAVSKAREKYGGCWKIGEKLKKINIIQKQKLQNTIIKITKEN